MPVWDTLLIGRCWHDDFRNFNIPSSKWTFHGYTQAPKGQLSIKNEKGKRTWTNFWWNQMGQAWKTIEKSKLTVRRPPNNENAFYTRSAPPKKRRARVKDAYNFLFWKVGQGRPQASWGGPGARARARARARAKYPEDTLILPLV